jgi:hypothetical protein
MAVFMKSTGRSGLGRRKAGTSRAWKKLIQHATLPSDEYLGVRAGTPADRRARTIANKKLKEMMGEGSKNVDAMDKARVEEITEQYEKYLRRNDGGIARKTKVF